MLRTRIEAENYRAGANGDTYFETSVGNSGGALRGDDVDIQASSEGGHNVGWIKDGEWLTYEVTVPEDGIYQLTARVASEWAGGQFKASIDGEEARVAFEATGGWQNWVSQAGATTLDLSAGTHVLRLDMLSSNFNINWLELEQLEQAPEPEPDPVPEPEPTVIRVEAEDYRAGANGDTYFDTSSGNSGSALRDGDVDIEASSEGGHNIGWIADGEWLTYKVTVTEDGVYQLAARVASLEAGGRLQVSIDGQTTTASFDATGGWQNWITADGEDTLELSAGTHTLRLDMRGSAFNVNWLELEKVAEPPETQPEPTPEPTPKPQPEPDPDAGGGSEAPQSNLPPTVVDVDPGTWSVVFEDTFEQFDYNKWAKSGEDHPITGVPAWTDTYLQMEGWDPGNVYVSDGNLHLRATKVGDQWLGGMVQQFKLPDMGWEYGYFEVRFKPPEAMQNGFTAPFWMMPQYPRQYWSGGGDEALGTAVGTPWPYSGEIDVVEQFLSNIPAEGEIAYSNAIFQQNDNYTSLQGPNYREIGTPLEDNWHTFGLHWFEDPNNNNKITMHYMHDGVVYKTNTQDDWGGQFSATAPFDQPFYLLMGIHGGVWNNGIDVGNGPGYPPDEWSGQEILVDHVRVWQKSETSQPSDVNIIPVSDSGGSSGDRVLDEHWLL